MDLKLLTCLFCLVINLKTHLYKLKNKITLYKDT